jgi:hypothetical protein
MSNKNLIVPMSNLFHEHIKTIASNKDMSVSAYVRTVLQAESKFNGDTRKDKKVIKDTRNPFID